MCLQIIFATSEAKGLMCEEPVSVLGSTQAWKIHFLIPSPLIMFLKSDLKNMGVLASLAMPTKHADSSVKLPEFLKSGLRNSTLTSNCGDCYAF